MSQKLKQSTAKTILLGPFLDATDGVTEETALTPASEISKDGGATFIAGPTGTHLIEGYYTFALTAAQTDALGHFLIKSHDSATHLPVWEKFIIQPAKIFDSGTGTDNLEVDVVQWLGSAVAAATAGTPNVNLVRVNNSTGAAKALEVGVGDFSSIDSVTSQTVFVLTAGGFPLIDNIYNGRSIIIRDVSASALTFNIRRVVDYAGSSGTITIDVACDFTVVAGDETVVLATALAEQITDDVWNRILTGATHNIATSAGRQLRELADGSILRSNSFQAGSTTTSLVLDSGASSIDDFYTNQLIVLVGGTAGGQTRIISSYDGTTKAATITPALNTAAPASGDGFEISVFGPVHIATAAQLLQNSSINTLASQTSFTLTVGSADDDAYNGATVVVTDSATSIQKAVGLITDYVGSTKTVTLDADPGIFTMGVGDEVDIIAVSTRIDAPISAIDTATMRGTDGVDTAAMRGTDSAALASVATEARLAELDPGNIPTDLSDIQGAGFVTGTDSLEAIRDRGDAAWTTGAGGSPPDLLQNTTIDALASQTSFTLIAGSADDDAYNGATIVVTDSATSEQKAVGLVLDYVGATKTVTLDADPGIFTMAAGDTVDIIAVSTNLDAPISAIDTAAMRGTDGVDTAAMRGTDSAALALVATEARLAELDPANIPTDLSDIKGSGFVTGDDSLEAIRNRGDAAWTTGAGGSPPDLLQNTTIDVLASQTSFTLIAGSADDDAYNGATIVITDSATAEQKAVGLVLDYVGATKTVTLDADPGIFTIVAGDTVDIVAVSTNLDAPISAIDTAAMRGTDGVDTSAMRGTDGVDTAAMRGTDSAALASVATEARLAELDPANLPSDVDDIGTRLPVDLAAGRMRSDMEALDGNTEAATDLRFSAATVVRATVDTTVAPTTTVFEADDVTEATADHFNGRIVIFTSGILKDQATDITDYALVAGRGRFTVTALTEAPGNNDTFVIV